MALYEDVTSSIESYFENYTIIIEKTALMLDCTTTFYMKAAPFLVSNNKKLCIAQSSLSTFEDEVKNNNTVGNFLRLAFKALQYMQNANFIETLNIVSINKNECDEIKICKEKLKDSNILLITQDASIKNLVLNLNQEGNNHHIVVKCFIDDGILSDLA